MSVIAQKKACQGIVILLKISSHMYKKLLDDTKFAVYHNIKANVLMLEYSKFPVTKEGGMIFLPGRTGEFDLTRESPDNHGPNILNF